MRKASVFGTVHSPLIRVLVDVEDGETYLDGLMRFDRVHGTNLVQRWRDGEWQIVPDLVIYNRSGAGELTALLDAPEDRDGSLPEGWTEGRR